MDILKVPGTTVGEALNDAQQRTNRKLFLAHMRVAAVAEDLARQGIESVMDTLERDPETRPLLWVVVTPREASRLLEVKPKLGAVPMFYLLDLLEDAVRMGRMSTIFLGQFLIRLAHKGEDPVLPWVIIGEDDVRLEGLAVFREDRMVDVLDIEDTWTLMLIRGFRKAGERFNVRAAGGHVGVAIFRRTRSLRLLDGSPGGPPVRIALELAVEGNIVEALGNIDVSRPEVIEVVEAILGRDLERRARDLVRKGQLLGADIFGFGEHVRARRPDIWRGIEWREAFPHIPVDITVDAKIRRTGLKQRT